MPNLSEQSSPASDACTSTDRGGPIQRAAGLPGEKLEQTAAHRSFPRKNVLVADDDKDLLDVTGMLLESFGFTVVSCSCPTEALALFRAWPMFDLLVTDLQMPLMSGAELAQQLAAIRPTMPILIVSGATIAGEMDAMFREQGWRFLAKPYRISEFLAQIQGLTGAEQPGLRDEA